MSIIFSRPAVRLGILSVVDVTCLPGMNSSEPWVPKWRDGVGFFDAMWSVSKAVEK